MNRLNDLYDLGLWIIRNFRTPISVYIIVSKNYIKVVSLENGLAASGDAEREFSTSRLLIADPIIAEKLATELLNRVCSATQLKTRSLNVICHPLDNELSNLSPAEKMIFTDFAFQIGGRHVRLIDDGKELTFEELKIRNYA
ncbi:MAG: hypothetical protein JST46_18770 [Bacteroidetes bacterium]|nr:hypothetical protein [Bacteroidota bacterium]